MSGRTRSIVIALAGVAAAGAAVAAAVYLRGGHAAPAFAEPPAGSLHLRPLAKAAIEGASDFPPAERWITAGYEVATPGPGRLVVVLEDRGREIVADEQVHEGGRLTVRAGVRELDAAAARARFPGRFRAEEERLADGGGEVRGFHVFRLLVGFEEPARPDGARGQHGARTLEGAFPVESALPLRGDLATARLGVAEEHGFTAIPADERVALVDWISLPKLFKTFDRSFAPRLPDSIGVDGIGKPIREHPTPVWRVSIRWEARTPPPPAQ